MIDECLDFSDPVHKIIAGLVPSPVRCFLAVVDQPPFCFVRVPYPCVKGLLDIKPYRADVMGMKGNIKRACPFSI